MAAVKGKKAKQRDAATVNSAIATATKCDPMDFNQKAIVFQHDANSAVAGLVERIMSLKREFDSISIAYEAKQAAIVDLSDKETLLMEKDKLEADIAEQKLKWAQEKADEEEARTRERAAWEANFAEDMRLDELKRTGAATLAAQEAAFAKAALERENKIKAEELAAREAAVAAAEAAMKTAKDEAVAKATSALNAEYTHKMALLESSMLANARLSEEQLRNANGINAQLTTRINEMTKQLADANNRVADMAGKVVDSKAQREVIDSLKATMENQSGTTKVGTR